MATIRQKASGAFEVIFRNKLLPRPVSETIHASEATVRAYAANVEAMLAKGEVPPEMLRGGERAATLGDWIERYRRSSRVADADLKILRGLPSALLDSPAGTVSVPWAMDWVSAMHREGLAPGTIKHKVGAVSRCLDWSVQMEFLPVNPLKSLPRNYSAYPKGHEQERIDTARTRRLEPGEESAIRAVLVQRPEWELLFTLALETAMRLQELYMLDWQNIDLSKRTVLVVHSKSGKGRSVPLSSVALSALRPLQREAGLLFSWWDGAMSSRARTTCRISHQWTRIASQAGCKNLHFHDLRAESVCRLYERTRLSDVQIARIVGHSNLKMLVEVYARLRGSDLAGELW